MALAKVTLDRIESWVKDQDLKYDIDQDGDVRIGFTEVILFIHQEGDLLRLQGYWYTQFEEGTDLERVREAVNTLNSQLLFPKCILNKGQSTVVFEIAALVHEKMTDEQLHNWLQNAFAAVFKAEENLSELLPDLAPKEEK